MDIPEFVDREREKRELKAILSGRPNFVYFVYGPINSGKTALLMKVIEELPDDYVVFYINFRGFETSKYEDFIRALFQPRDETLWEKLRKKADIIQAALEYAEKLIKKINYEFEVPSRVLKTFFSSEEKERDVFRYLEVLMRRLVEKGKIPVFILDELQMLKEVKKNGYVLHDLFNFLVRMTKETHLCHSLCATSDCLFIEDVYSNARLEGRAEYLLVDDFDKETAFRVYEEFGIENKELVWDYIGGKIGDIIRLGERKKRGLEEKDILENLLKVEVDRLDEMLRKIKRVKKKIVFEGKEIEIEEEGIRESLSVFKDAEKVSKDKIDVVYRYFLVEENVLFYNPMEGTVRPQSRLIWRAIKEVV